ncbi:hypothetical protein CDL15_Pgr022506 [Punica granatum]|nr:hypothetical protein CDL15_Pgr022506 [Punica granatum]
MTDFLWKIASDASVQPYKLVRTEQEKYLCTSVRVMRRFIFEFHRGKGKQPSSWKELNCDAPWKNCSSSVQPPVVSMGGKVPWMILLYYSKLETMLPSLDLSTEKLWLVEILLDAPALADEMPCWFLSNRVFCCGWPSPCSRKDLELWVIDDFDYPVWRKHHVVKNALMASFDTACCSDAYCEALEPAGMFMADKSRLIMSPDGKEFVYEMSSREWTRTSLELACGDLLSTWHCSLDFCICVHHVNSQLRFD